MALVIVVFDQPVEVDFKAIQAIVYQQDGILLLFRPVTPEALGSRPGRAKGVWTSPRGARKSQEVLDPPGI
jgi:hypothetical protein